MPIKVQRTYINKYIYQNINAMHIGNPFDQGILIFGGWKHFEKTPSGFNILTGLKLEGKMNSIIFFGHRED
jgi:hypothetical protein